VSIAAAEKPAAAGSCNSTDSGRVSELCTLLQLQWAAAHLQSSSAQLATAQVRQLSNHGCLPALLQASC
jgi:hypothetical protein